MCKKVVGIKKPKQDVSEPDNLTIIPRDQHNISRRDINQNALKVLYRLNDAGFNAYLVGGGVRDILLGLKPKDFDITTNATPEQIKSLFSNCRLIGRRFRLAHIVFGRDIIEVATFRGHHDDATEKSTSKQSEQGQLLRDNVYGSIDEDAERRDFSINALYYNIADFSIRDYWQGIDAIDAREIRLIGDPETRYREDPVRMLRAIRFAEKLNMTIAAETAAPIKTLAPLLSNIPAARLFEESLKLFMSGQGLNTFKQLVEYNLFQQMFPHLVKTVANKDDRAYQIFVIALSNTDKRIATNQRVTPAFLFATMLWYDVEKRAIELQLEGGLANYDALQIAISEALDSNRHKLFIPKRFSAMIREMWSMQPRLENRLGKRPYKLLEHPKFRAAFDFLLLRAEIEGGELTELADWWTQFQQANPNKQTDLVGEARTKSGESRGSNYKRRNYRNNRAKKSTNKKES